MTGSPLVLRTGNSDWCFVRGSSGRPFYKQRTGSAWNTRNGGWVELGGSITGGLSGDAVGSRLAIAARGAGTQQAAIKWWDGDVWRPGTTRWIGLESVITGSILGPPILIAGQGGMVHLLVRGVGRRIFMQSFRDSGWSGSWQNLGGTAIDSPTAVALPLARGRGPELHVFITGVSNAGFRKVKVWNGSKWSPAGDQWERLGGYLDWGL